MASKRMITIMPARRQLSVVSAAFAVACIAATEPTGCREFTVQRPRGGAAPIIRAADYGFSATNDFNAAAINRAMEACRATGARTLELAAGEYKCFDSPCGIAVTNMTDFTFDGCGAVLVFRRPAEFRGQPQSELIHENANLLVKNCERVTVCDFKMEWGSDPLGCCGKNGINLVGSRHVRVQDVDIWSCGIGIVIDGKQQYTQIENVRIVPRPDAPYKRPYSTVSDGLHVARSSGFLKLLNFTVKLNTDDAVNLAYGTDNVILRNCVFEDSTPRNLFSSSNLTIEDCTFRRTGSRSAWIPADACTQLGLNGTNIVIRGNTFEGNRLATGMCEICAFLTKRGAESRDILIENNVFLDPFGPVFRTEAGSRITFRDNEIRFTRQPYSAESGTARNLGARDVKIEGNFWTTNETPQTIIHPSFATVTVTDLVSRPIKGSAAYVVEGGYIAESVSPGAVIGLSIIELDAAGNTLAEHDSSGSMQSVWATGYPRRILVRFTTHADAKAVQVKICAGGNSVTFTPLQCFVRAESRAPFYRGIYDKEDPPPEDRAGTLAKMAAIPPATPAIERRQGRNLLVVDGKPMPFNQYKGFTDYRLMGECGGDLVMTFNRGTRLFRDASFDRANRDKVTGEYDFSRIEDTLLRIYHANPNARVILGILVDPDKAFLENNTDAIFTNEQGVRGVADFGAFVGFSSAPLDPNNPHAHWAYSYTSTKWREYVKEGLAKLCAYLKTTPAANIVIGFRLAGGMDGQFVQWQYGPENGHFDYSEENRRALCNYLTEIYGTDAVLQAAWGDPNVTLATAKNPSVAEFRSVSVFNDKPGIGRRLADCRRFVAVGPARTLNDFAQTLKREFGRLCLVDTWYTSSIWSQPGRLALDELIKDGGMDIIATVSGYSSLREVTGPGCSADNSIAGLNLRGLLFVQEMDHRSWRTEITGGRMRDSLAIPADEHEFANQIRRDGASVIAAGGAGFHLYDMFGSWYHGSKVKGAIQEIFALNRFATQHAGNYPLPRLAILTDEKARLLRENTYDNVNILWRTSGVMPTIHYLSDLDNPAMPEYDAYVVWSPITITAAQATELKRRASKTGKVLAIIGEVGTGSRDYANAAEALAQFGLKITHHSGTTCEAVLPLADTGDPLLEGVTGVLEMSGMCVAKQKLVRRYQYGFTDIDDPTATVLGKWERSGKPAFVRKPIGDGTLVHIAREGGVTPVVLNNLARMAGIKPHAAPGNATYVGNGVAAVHSLGAPVKIEFDRPVTLVDPVSQTRSEPVTVWTPSLQPGECAAIGYLP